MRESWLLVVVVVDGREKELQTLAANNGFAIVREDNG